MGANGAGKSTLLSLVAGVRTPDAGSALLGASVKLGYFAQHSMELLEADATVWQTLSNAFPKASIGSLRALATAGRAEADGKRSARVRAARPKTYRTCAGRRSRDRP